MTRYLFLASVLATLAATGCAHEQRDEWSDWAIRNEVWSSTETIQRPGQPTQIRQRRGETYQGPVYASSGQPVVVTTSPTPVGSNVRPAPRPMPDTKPGASLPATRLPDKATVTDDEEIPRATITGVYGIAPDGTRIPAKRYDENGKLIEDKPESPNHDLPPGSPTHLPPTTTLPTTQVPATQPPTVLPPTTVQPPPILLPPVPTIQQPPSALPSLPSVPTVPAPPPPALPKNADLTRTASLKKS